MWREAAADAFAGATSASATPVGRLSTTVKDADRWCVRGGVLVPSRLTGTGRQTASGVETDGNASPGASSGASLTSKSTDKLHQFLVGCQGRPVSAGGWPSKGNRPPDITLYSSPGESSNGSARVCTRSCFSRRVARLRTQAVARAFPHGNLCHLMGESNDPSVPLQRSKHGPWQTAKCRAAFPYPGADPQLNRAELIPNKFTIFSCHTELPKISVTRAPTWA